MLDALDGRASVSLAAEDDEGRQFLYTYVPVDVADRRSGALELSEPMSHVGSYTRTSIRQALLLSAGLLLCGVIVTILLGIRFIGQPLEQLMAKLRRIGEGDLTTGHSSLKRHDEFGTLAATLDGMCEDLAATQRRLQSETAARIKTLEELRHADRLRTVGRLSAGVAHELGTPLNVVAERARIIQEECRDNREVSDSAHVIEQQSGRMTDIVRQLLDFARRRPSDKVMTDLRDLARQTVEMLRPLAGKHQVRLQFRSPGPSVESFVFKQQIQQVLINLIDNAVEVSPPDSEVAVQVTRAIMPTPTHPYAVSGAYARLDVLDQGGGILAEDVERIFEPFFTTKDVGRGTGLGLSIAYSIVEEHGGWIDAASRTEGGTSFSVYLPIRTLLSSTEAEAAVAVTT